MNKPTQQGKQSTTTASKDSKVATSKQPVTKAASSKNVLASSKNTGEQLEHSITKTEKGASASGASHIRTKSNVISKAKQNEQNEKSSDLSVKTEADEKKDNPHEEATDAGAKSPAKKTPAKQQTESKDTVASVTKSTTKGTLQKSKSTVTKSMIKGSATEHTEENEKVATEKKSHLQDSKASKSQVVSKPKTKDATHTTEGNEETKAQRTAKRAVTQKLEESKTKERPAGDKTPTKLPATKTKKDEEHKSGDGSPVKSRQQNTKKALTMLPSKNKHESHEKIEEEIVEKDANFSFEKQVLQKIEKPEAGEPEGAENETKNSVSNEDAETMHQTEGPEETLQTEENFQEVNNTEPSKPKEKTLEKTKSKKDVITDAQKAQKGEPKKEKVDVKDQDKSKKAIKTSQTAKTDKTQTKSNTTSASPEISKSKTSSKVEKDKGKSGTQEKTIKPQKSDEPSKQEKPSLQKEKSQGKMAIDQKPKEKATPSLQKEKSQSKISNSKEESKTQPTLQRDKSHGRIPTSKLKKDESKASEKKSTHEETKSTTSPAKKSTDGTKKKSNATKKDPTAETIIPTEASAVDTHANENDDKDEKENTDSSPINQSPNKQGDSTGNLKENSFDDINDEGFEVVETMSKQEPKNEKNSQGASPLHMQQEVSDFSVIDGSCFDTFEITVKEKSIANGSSGKDSISGFESLGQEMSEGADESAMKIPAVDINGPARFRRPTLIKKEEIIVDQVNEQRRSSIKAPDFLSKAKGMSGLQKLVQNAVELTITEEKPAKTNEEDHTHSQQKAGFRRPTLVAKEEKDGLIKPLTPLEMLSSQDVSTSKIKVPNFLSKATRGSILNNVVAPIKEIQEEKEVVETKVEEKIAAKNLEETEVKSKVKEPNFLGQAEKVQQNQQEIANINELQKVSESVQDEKNPEGSKTEKSDSTFEKSPTTDHSSRAMSTSRSELMSSRGRLSNSYNFSGLVNDYLNTLQSEVLSIYNKESHQGETQEADKMKKADILEEQIRRQTEIYLDELTSKTLTQLMPISTEKEGNKPIQTSQNNETVGQTDITEGLKKQINSYLDGLELYAINEVKKEVSKPALPGNQPQTNEKPDSTVVDPKLRERTEIAKLLSTLYLEDLASEALGQLSKTLAESHAQGSAKTNEVILPQIEAALTKSTTDIMEAAKRQSKLYLDDLAINIPTLASDAISKTKSEEILQSAQRQSKLYTESLILMASEFSLRSSESKTADILANTGCNKDVNTHKQTVENLSKFYLEDLTERILKFPIKEGHNETQLNSKSEISKDVALSNEPLLTEDKDAIILEAARRMTATYLNDLPSYIYSVSKEVRRDEANSNKENAQTIEDLARKQSMIYLAELADSTSIKLAQMAKETAEKQIQAQAIIYLETLSSRILELAMPQLNKKEEIVTKNETSAKAIQAETISYLDSLASRTLELALPQLTAKEEKISTMNETTVKVIQAETTSYLDSLTSRVLKFAMPLLTIKEEISTTNETTTKIIQEETISYLDTLTSRVLEQALPQLKSKSETREDILRKISEKMALEVLKENEERAVQTYNGMLLKAVLKVQAKFRGSLARFIYKLELLNKHNRSSFIAGPRQSIKPK